MSTVHVTVLKVVDVLPQASLAVKVLVFERPQSVLCTYPSLCVTVGIPHASVALAVPNAALISDAAGLHDTSGGAVSSEITGDVTS